MPLNPESGANKNLTAENIPIYGHWKGPSKKGNPRTTRISPKGGGRRRMTNMETLSGEEFYDRLARVFDVMTDWNSRLGLELPFIEETLRKHGATRVLDVACGTGRHSIALAERGYPVVGWDASPRM